VATTVQVITCNRQGLSLRYPVVFASGQQHKKVWPAETRV
jgi:hypothetical protein